MASCGIMYISVHIYHPIGASCGASCWHHDGIMQFLISKYWKI